MLRTGLPDVRAVKDYQPCINDECYVDQSKHEAERSTLDASSFVYGGDGRLATMHEYVLHDDMSDFHSHGDQVAFIEDGRRRIQTYLEDVQYKVPRLQHHMHPLNATTKGREPLRSCLSTSGGKDCKHSSPKTAFLTEELLLVCDGIALERGSLLKGNRVMLGCTLGRRTCENKNGVSKFFSAGLPCCNCDVSPDLRAPLIVETHDPRCPCAGVGRASLRAVAREAPSAATRKTGDFGGYIGKAQLVGKTERCRCEEGMLQLAAQHETDPAAVQVRACARRPIADLEAKCTLRSNV